MNRGKLTEKEIRTFQKCVYTYYRNNKRELPWRLTTNPYKILVSEIMLQQTQVPRVIPKYNEFIRQFPNINSLSRAPLRKVLRAWSGLGYNRRASSLQRAAQQVTRDFNGAIPRSHEALVTLPGIGNATAQAILAYVYNLPVVFIETNIRTVFIHQFFKGRKEINDKDILPLVEQTLDREKPRVWYSALMDYGTMLKEQYGNASKQSAHYTRQSRFEGSHRQLRGFILKELLKRKGVRFQELEKTVKYLPQAISLRGALKELEQERFITKTRTLFRIA